MVPPSPPRAPCALLRGRLSCERRRPGTQALTTAAQLGLAKLGMALDLNALVVYPTVVAPIGFGWFLYHFAYVLFPILNEKLFYKLFK